MALVDQLDTTFPNRDRLSACEQALRADISRQQVLDNIDVSIKGSLIDPTQFEQFCTQLGALLPDPPEVCNEQYIATHIDEPGPMCCQGDPIPAEPDTQLSRMINLQGFLWARLGRSPSDTEIEDERRKWDMGLAGSAYPQLSMRTARAFFWVTLSERLRNLIPATPDHIRDMLGLSHYEHDLLLEARFPASEDRQNKRAFQAPRRRRISP